MNNVTGALLFGLGAIIGAGSTYIYLKNQFDNELDSANKMYNARLERLKDEKSADINDSEDDTKEVSEDNVATPEEHREYIDYASKYTSDPSKTIQDYANIYAKPPVREVVRSVIEEASDEEPYLISEDDYTFYEQNEKVTLTVHSDGVVENAITHQVIFEEEFLHKIGRDLVKELNEDNPQIYVRNPVFGIDYDILYDDEEFTETW